MGRQRGRKYGYPVSWVREANVYLCPQVFSWLSLTKGRIVTREKQAVGSPGQCTSLGRTVKQKATLHSSLDFSLGSISNTEQGVHFRETKGQSTQVSGSQGGLNSRKVTLETAGGGRLVCRFFWKGLWAGKSASRKRRIYFLPFCRKGGGELFLSLQLHCLQLKIICMSKRHLLG